MNEKEAEDDEAVLDAAGALMETILAFDEALAEAVDAHRKADDGTGRDGAVAALHAVVNLILDLANQDLVASGRIAPFMALANALRALDGGRQVPLVIPAPVENGRPPESQGEWAIKGAIAAAVELRFRELQRSGVGAALSQACVWVANQLQLRRWDVFPSTRTPLATTVRNARNVFIGAPGDDAATDAGRVLFSHYTTNPEFTAEDVLDDAIRRLGITLRQSM